MKLLVTGASGLLGANLVLAAADRGHPVCATSRSSLAVASGVAGVVAVVADLGHPGVAERVCRETRPEWVLHCAADTNVDRCEAEPEAAEQSNVSLTRAVVAGAAAVGARVLYVSTDSVFPGDRGNYGEEDPTGPVNQYARTKLAGESELASSAAGGVILRTNLYGWNALAKASLAEWILGRLDRGETVPGFANVIFNPLLVNDLADVMLALVEGEARGLFHAGARDHCSKFEFARKLAELTGHPPDRIARTELQPATLRAPRPCNTWLRTERLAGFLGRPLPSIDEGLRRFVDLGAGGHRARLKSLLA